MANTEGIRHKFQVLKAEDIEKLSHEEKVTLGHIVERIMENRTAEGKTNDSMYLVINTDEPYADQVIDIMKSHGHWG